MLSEQRIRELFAEYLPDGITILNISATEFVDQIRPHPFVKLQIQMGIYSDANLAEDFLSPARAHKDLGLQVICVEIFNRLLAGIPADIAENYVRHVAAHEAHHFHEDHDVPVSAADHAASELVCAQEIIAAHPELNVAVGFVEANSEVYRRVFARIDALQKNLQMKGSVTP